LKGWTNDRGHWSGAIDEIDGSSSLELLRRNAATLPWEGWKALAEAMESACLLFSLGTRKSLTEGKPERIHLDNLMMFLVEGEAIQCWPARPLITREESPTMLKVHLRSKTLEDALMIPSKQARLSDSLFEAPRMEWASPSLPMGDIMYIPQPPSGGQEDWEPSKKRVTSFGGSKKRNLFTREGNRLGKE